MTIEPTRCFCGGLACACSIKIQGKNYYRVHCQDCDWSFGGSSLEFNKDRNAVIGEWNRCISALSKVQDNAKETFWKIESGKVNKRPAKDLLDCAHNCLHAIYTFKPGKAGEA
jgi:hypothetical protein